LEAAWADKRVELAAGAAGGCPADTPVSAAAAGWAVVPIATVVAAADGCALLPTAPAGTSPVLAAETPFISGNSAALAAAEAAEATAGIGCTAAVRFSARPEAVSCWLPAASDGASELFGARLVGTASGALARFARFGALPVAAPAEAAAGKGSLAAGAPRLDCPACWASADRNGVADGRSAHSVHNS